MNYSHPPRSLFRKSCALAVLLALWAGGSAAARVLDDFPGTTKSGWTDFTFQPGLGSVTQSNGLFIIDVPGINTAVFAASTKTSESFVLQPGRTLEFRVKLVSGNDPKSVAVLGWFPESQSVSTLSGYGLAVSSDRIVVSKGLNKYFWDGAAPPKAANVVLVLSLTETTNADVLVQTRILDSDNNLAVLFDKTFLDTAGADVLARGTDSPAAPWTGSGHVSLLNYADEPSNGSLPVYEVTYAHLEAFTLNNQVLDDFNASSKSGWTDFTFQPGLGTVVQSNGVFTIDVPGINTAVFAASTKTSTSFTVQDGDRIEARVDLVNSSDHSAVAVLGWFPESQSVATLSGYGLAVSSDRIVVTKGLNKYFYDAGPPDQYTNVVLSLSLTGAGTSVIYEARVLDKDPTKTNYFDGIFVDTVGADPLARGTDSPAPPWTGSGHFALLNYADEPSSGAQAVYEVVFDNLNVSSPPPPANLPAIISNVQPLSFTNYVPASSQISFQVTDDKPLVDSQISIILNGQTNTTASGLVVTGSGTNRTVSLGGLATNVNYVATLRVVDSDGAITTQALYFDTFIASDLVIESEDYNFSSGQFIDNPIPTAEGTGAVNSYDGQTGEPGVDFFDTRTSPNGTDTMYRPADPVRMQHTFDVIRQKFSAAGGPAASVYDYDVGDIAAGEWLNYTRTFPPGSYQVYLREALFNGDQAKADLYLVTGDRTLPNPAATSLGSFLATRSGFQYRNVPLTDGAGLNKITLRLNGVQTLQLRQATSDPSGGAIFQNYLVFIPVPDAGVQRATISSLTPANGATVTTATPVLIATIQNRDTSVQTNTIVLSLNGTAVAPGIAGSTNGVTTVTYTISPLPVSGATNSARLVFKDSQSVLVTNDWSFVITYSSLNPANRQFGPGVTNGMAVHVVQAPSGSNLANSLDRAENQLAANSTIPRAVDTNFLAGVINYNQADGSSSEFGPTATIPGIDPATNGTDDYAAEILTYLDLTAGVHRFGVTSDDGYKIASGAALRDTSAPLLGFHNAGPANETFDFVVTQAGLYPFRMVWYNRGGAGYADWFSVDLTSGAHVLINDTNSPNAVRAYVGVSAAPQVHLESVARIGDTFTEETSAVIDASARTITVARPAGNRFYRLRGSAGVPSFEPSGIKVTASNLVITYNISANAGN